MTDFKSRLTQLRESNDWSKTTVAKHLGIPLSTYANYEYGLREPDIETIGKIAKLYNVTTDYLFGIEKSAPQSTINESVDLKEDPVILSYGGKPISDKQMDLIKGILDLKTQD